MGSECRRNGRGNRDAHSDFVTGSRVFDRTTAGVRFKPGLHHLEGPDTIAEVDLFREGLPGYVLGGVFVVDDVTNQDQLARTGRNRCAGCSSSLRKPDLVFGHLRKLQTNTGKIGP